MIRLFLVSLIVLASACITRVEKAPTTTPTVKAVERTAAPAEPTGPRNFVCERLAEEGNTKATCKPERTEPHIHTARITIDGQTVSCGLPEDALSVACASLFYQPQPKEPLPTLPPNGEPGHAATTAKPTTARKAPPK